jgi:hypothetical protein
MPRVRPIRGLDRPPLQWLFAALALVLILVTVTLAVTLRRAQARADALLVAEAEALLVAQRLEIELARERSASEALAIQVGRLKGPERTSDTAPTLTLTPPASRSATPPEPTVPPPAPAQSIALRLVLPPGADTSRRFSITIRDWSTGEVHWRRHGLAAATVEGRPVVVAHVAGDVFARGAYEVVLSAGEEVVASYEMAVGS